MIFYYKDWLQNTKPYWENLRHPNTIAKWHPADTNELFTENFKKYSDSIHLQNYLKNPIEYKYNNYGFRTPDDFTLEDGNVFLGCSHTFGIGHHLKDVWSYKLSQMIGGKFYNISEPGSGIYAQYRYLTYFKDRVKFKNVFHFLPNECWGRYEFIDSNDNFNGVSGFNDSEEVVNLLFADKQIHLLNYVYIDAIRYMLNQIGVNYYLVTKTWLDIDNIDPYHKTLTPARDLMHYYAEEHTELANLFYYKYKNGLTDNTDNSFLLEEKDIPKII